MLKFPGEGVKQITKDEKLVYSEPLPDIGKIVTCKVVKLTPTQAFFSVSHIDGQKTSIEYKTIVRPQDVGVNIIEGQFVWDKIVKGNKYHAKIVSFGDANGMFISLLNNEN